METTNVAYVNLFGYRIFNHSLSKCVKDVIRLSHHKTIFVSCANPHSLVVASRDAGFRRALQSSDILLPDGVGIVIAARLLNLPIKEKIAGYDFFFSLSERLNSGYGKKYFFLGSTQNVLERIRARLNKDFPNIIVCGTYSPPFKDRFSENESTLMINAVNRARPDVLWVGMTAPKQEKWIYRNLDKLNVPLVAAIGAVFDFYAGTKKRSSDFWIKIGLEWFPRFLKEPRRLWERNLKSTPIFLWWILKEKIKQIS